MFKDILISYISQEELLQKAQVTCHEFAFYCLGEGLELERGSKMELIQGLIKAFVSTVMPSSGPLDETGGQEYLELILTREFEEMKDEVKGLMERHGLCKEEVLKRLLMRLGLFENEAREISKKIIHALQTLELPGPDGYYPSSESIKFAIN